MSMLALDAVFDNQVVENQETSICSHSAGTCYACAIKIDDDFRVAFLHANKNLRFSDPKTEYMNNLLRRRKLFLVLDLDHTLLHSVRYQELTAHERCLYANKDNLPYSVTRLDDLNAITKLRPFVHPFLKQASELFEMHICTMGSRYYALTVMKLIDPDNVYFNNYTRVTAKEDWPAGKKKSLDVFLAKENEKAVVVLDDSEEVWEDNKRNLIVTKSYDYFVSQKNKCINPNSHSVSKTDESRSTGTLASALEILRCIHGEFFNVADQDEGLAHQDVRRVMSMMAGESNSENTLRC